MTGVLKEAVSAFLAVLDSDSLDDLVAKQRTGAGWLSTGADALADTQAEFSHLP